MELNKVHSEPNQGLLAEKVEALQKGQTDLGEKLLKNEISIGETIKVISNQVTNMSGYVEKMSKKLDSLDEKFQILEKVVQDNGFKASKRMDRNAGEINC